VLLRLAVRRMGGWLWTARLSDVVQEVNESRRPVARRWATRALLTLGGVITFLAVVLVVAAWTEDVAIDGDMRRVNAEVVSDDFSRTLIRFYTPDGAEHIPQTGVLYPSGLRVGDVVKVEYRLDNPEQVRVAGRNAVVTVLPVGLTLLGVWAVLVPSVWWLRRRL
jgi:hypothetical protein